MIIQIEIITILLQELVILLLNVIVKQVVNFSIGSSAPVALTRDVSLEISEEPRAKVNWRSVLR